MRNNYPLSSQEFNDKVLQNYENLVYLVGYDGEETAAYTGLYEHIDSSGVAMLQSTSGVPIILGDEFNGGLNLESSFNRYIELLKVDYMWRKLYNKISYFQE